MPNDVTVQDGSYEPLSRPLFIYVKNEALENESVYEFTKYTLEMATEMAAEVGYVALPAESYEAALTTLEEFKISKIKQMTKGCEGRERFASLASHLY